MRYSIDIQHSPLINKLKEKGLPLSFSFEITSRCNLNCRHCYINISPSCEAALNTELSLTSILDIGNQAVKLGSIWCLLTGGEPLLRKDFSDIYLGLKKLGLLVSVFTNCTLVTSEHIDLFTSYPPRDIEVTVYGISERTYEQITRVPGSYRRFRAGLDRLQNAGCQVRLKAMALQSNWHEIDEITFFCKQNTKDYFRLDPQLHLRYDHDPQRNKDILAERLTPEQIVSLDTSDSAKREALQKICSKQADSPQHLTNPPRLFRCGIGTTGFVIGHRGDFRLCSSLRAPGTTCDLMTIPLIEAWKTLVSSVRRIQPSSAEFAEECSKCRLVNICLSCPAHAYLETGHLDRSVPYFCEVAQQRAAALYADDRNSDI